MFIKVIIFLPRQQQKIAVRCSLRRIEVYKSVPKSTLLILHLRSDRSVLYILDYFFRCESGFERQVLWVSCNYKQEMQFTAWETANCWKCNRTGSAVVSDSYLDVNNQGASNLCLVSEESWRTLTEDSRQECCSNENIRAE